VSPVKAKRRSSPSDPIVVAQSQTLDVFAKLVRSQLKPVLGAAGQQRVRTDLAICTSVGGGVVIQAPLQLAVRFDPRRLERKSKIVAVVCNTIPLVDPVSLIGIDPGVYAWAVRKVSADVVAFDFFNRRGAPALSTIARQKDDAGPDGGNIPFLDVHISRGGEPDALLPPGTMFICLSLLYWEHCFFLNWPPRLPWPW
jgi:hypothetical protein